MVWCFAEERWACWGRVDPRCLGISLVGRGRGDVEVRDLLVEGVAEV